MNSLRQMLREIKAGKTAFYPQSSSEQDLSDFQGTVFVLKEAKSKGLFSKFEPHNESYSGHDWVDCVVVGELTKFGEIELRDTEERK